MPDKQKQISHRARGVGIGIALGAVFGISQDNVGLGIALGLCLGVAYGEAQERKENGKTDKDKD